jgi:ketol-acid reductoisomerase
MIRDVDVSLDPIRGFVVGVLGLGNQGLAQALNLRDSGFDVRVGLRSGSPRLALAAQHGLAVDTPARVAAACDLVMLLAPDQALEEFFREAVKPGLRPGAAIGFAHGAALHFGAWEFPEDSDVFLVAPAGPGVQLRTRFLAGEGIPAVVAVARDASGRAEARALAYAKAIGCTRAGVSLATVRDEAVVDLFGEQAVLCGGVAALVTGAFETLVGAGYPAEMAYLECVQQLRLTVDLIHDRGLAGMWSAVSTAARYGGLSRGPAIVGDASREAMRRALADIESGEFFSELRRDRAQGGRKLDELRRAAYNPEMERVGRRVRALFRLPEN